MHVHQLVLCENEALDQHSKLFHYLVPQVRTRLPTQSLRVFSSKRRYKRRIHNEIMFGELEDGA